MKNTYYFSHDMNARNDEKILILRSEHGWEGYGIYFALLEMMFEAENSRLNFANLKLISYNLNLKTTKLQKLINFCCSIELFEKDESYFWSNGLKKRKEKVERKIEQTRQAGIISAEKRKQKKQQELEKSCNANLTNVKKISNENLTNKIKENKNKEDNNAINNNSDKLQQKFVECIGSTNLNSIQECLTYLEDLPYDVITLALEKTSDINGNWKYAKAILDDWIDKKIDTVEKVKISDENFKNRKKSMTETDWEKIVNMALKNKEELHG